MVPFLKSLSSNPALALETVSLSTRAYPEASDVARWCEDKGFTGLADKMVKKAGQWFGRVREASEFVTDSARAVLTDGALMSVGLLSAEVAKSQSAALPTFSPDQLHILGELNILEVTLCESPVLGEVARIDVYKSQRGVEGAESEVFKSGQIRAVDEDQQVAYGYVLAPDHPDLQGDIVPLADIEPAAHSLMRNVSKGVAKGGGVGLEHQEFSGIGYPVESYVDHAGHHGIPGGWWFGLKVESDSVWKSIKEGKIKGFSIGGKRGRYEPIGDLFSVLKAKNPDDVAKADATFDQTRSAVADAIRIKARTEYAWIEAIYQDRVIYHQGDRLFMADYSVDSDGGAELEDPKEVRVEYVAKSWGDKEPQQFTKGQASNGHKERQSMDPEDIKKAVAAVLPDALKEALESQQLETVKKSEPGEVEETETETEETETETETEETETEETESGSSLSVDEKLDKLLEAQSEVAETLKSHSAAINDHSERIDIVAKAKRSNSHAAKVGGAAQANAPVTKSNPWRVHPTKGFGHN